jgi:hypothetical protein
MVRFSRSCIAAFTVVATAACGNDALSPRSDAPSRSANARITTRNRTATSADITVDSHGGAFILGQHSIRFPRKSICALDSSYGPTEWDKPCTPASEPITFHVEIVIQDGRQWLDFTPAVRFVPTNDPNRYVWLGMQTTAFSTLSDDDLQILWSPAVGVAGVDESLSDPTLRTIVNQRSGWMVRRIKHFSGYNVSDRSACVPTDAECVKEAIGSDVVDGQ